MDHAKASRSGGGVCRGYTLGGIGAHWAWLCDAWKDKVDGGCRMEGVVWRVCGEEHGKECG